jgi:hypothetical protein
MPSERASIPPHTLAHSNCLFHTDKSPSVTFYIFQLHTSTQTHQQQTEPTMQKYGTELICVDLHRVCVCLSLSLSSSSVHCCTCREIHL